MSRREKIRNGVNSVELIYCGEDLEVYSKSNRRPLEYFKKGMP